VPVSPLFGRQPETLPPQPPTIINGEMREYQRKGLGWLVSMFQNGVNAVLADEMGLVPPSPYFSSCFHFCCCVQEEMVWTNHFFFKKNVTCCTRLGKTLQTISFLAYIKDVLHVSGPYIVVVPLSVLTNWCNEFRKWCPSMRVIKLHSSSREGLFFNFICSCTPIIHWIFGLTRSANLF